MVSSIGLDWSDEKPYSECILDSTVYPGAVSDAASVGLEGRSLPYSDRAMNILDSLRG